MKTILPNLIVIIVEAACVENGSRTRGEISKIALYRDCLTRVSVSWESLSLPVIALYFSFFIFLYHHSWLNNTVSFNWGMKFPLPFEWEIAKRAFPMSDTPMNSGYGIRFQREQQNSPSWGTRIRFFLSLSVSLIRNLVKRNSSLKEVPRSLSFSFQKFRESVN